jgi:cytochrome c biogenesis protein CcmG/thiol:disulfide interchange protein DsbE
MPALVRVHDRYRDKGIEFAGVSMDEDPAKVAPPFIKQYGVSYPILVPPVESALANAVQNLPTSFLIDASGKIARTWVGAVRERDLGSAIDKLLTEVRP